MNVGGQRISLLQPVMRSSHYSCPTCQASSDVFQLWRLNCARRLECTLFKRNIVKINRTCVQDVIRSVVSLYSSFTFRCWAASSESNAWVKFARTTVAPRKPAMRPSLWCCGDLANNRTAGRSYCAASFSASVGLELMQFKPVAYPGILFGGVQQIQLRTEGRENGVLGAVAP